MAAITWWPPADDAGCEALARFVINAGSLRRLYMINDTTSSASNWFKSVDYGLIQSRQALRGIARPTLEIVCDAPVKPEDLIEMKGAKDVHGLQLNTIESIRCLALGLSDPECGLRKLGITMNCDHEQTVKRLFESLQHGPRYLKALQIRSLSRSNIVA